MKRIHGKRMFQYSKSYKYYRTYKYFPKTALQNILDDRIFLASGVTFSKNGRI